MMKCIFLLGALAMIALQTGCGENRPRNVGDEYLRSTLGSMGRAESVAGTAALNSAIQLFNVENGRNPKSLQELKDKNFLHQMPPAPPRKKWAYDPQTGKVSLADI
jgi:hypothetical protein